MGMEGQPHVPAASTPGKDPVPIVQEAGWASGTVQTGAENLAPTGIRSPDRPARSQQLYRLSYPTRRCVYVTSIIRQSIICTYQNGEFGLGAHPASCTMGTGSFPGVKCGRGVLLTTHPLLVPRSWKSRAIPLPTLWVTPGLLRDHFTFTFYNPELEHWNEVGGYGQVL